MIVRVTALPTPSRLAGPMDLDCLQSVLKADRGGRASCCTSLVVRIKNE